MPLPNISPGSWFEIPNTKFSTFADANGIPAFLPRGGNGRSGIFAAWNSMGYDFNRKLWFSIAAGGHADWSGNQAVAFHVDNLVWSVRRLHDGLADTLHSSGYPPVDGNNTNQMFVDGKIRVVSSVATDTRLVTITGYDTTETQIQEILQLNGTTTVLSTNTFRWVLNITLSAANSAAGGVCTVRNDTVVQNVNQSIWFPAASNTDTSKTNFSGPFAVDGTTSMRGSTANYADVPSTASLTSPSARHEYGGVCYLAKTDRWATMGGIYVGTGGSTPPTIWLFNPTTNAYHLPTVGSSSRPGGSASNLIWDKTLNCAWLRTSSGLYQHFDDTNIFTQRFILNASVTNSWSVIDEVGRAVYTVNMVSGTAITVSKFDISTPTAVTHVSLPITGNIDVRRSYPAEGAAIEGLGAAWIGDRIAIAGRRADGKFMVYSYDPDTGILLSHDTAGVVPPGLPGTGLWNRFMTPDGLHIFLLIGQSDNIWAYRIPWGGAQPLRPIGVSAAVMP